MAVKPVTDATGPYLGVSYTQLASMFYVKTFVKGETVIHTVLWTSLQELLMWAPMISNSHCPVLWGVYMLLAFVPANTMAKGTVTVRPAHHGSTNDYKGDRPILGCVIHADGSLVLGEHIGKGRVDGDGIDSVQAARHVGNARQGGLGQEMEPVVILHHQQQLGLAIKVKTDDEEASQQKLLSKLWTS